MITRPIALVLRSVTQIYTLQREVPNNKEDFFGEYIYCTKQTARPLRSRLLNLLGGAKNLFDEAILKLVAVAQSGAYYERM